MRDDAVLRRALPLGRGLGRPHYATNYHENVQPVSSKKHQNDILRKYYFRASRLVFMYNREHATNSHQNTDNPTQVLAFMNNITTHNGQ